MKYRRCNSECGMKMNYPILCPNHTCEHIVEKEIPDPSEGFLKELKGESEEVTGRISRRPHGIC